LIFDFEIFLPGRKARENLHLFLFYTVSLDWEGYDEEPKGELSPKQALKLVRRRFPSSNSTPMQHRDDTLLICERTISAYVLIVKLMRFYVNYSLAVFMFY
jgi:hypothetical protein